MTPLRLGIVGTGKIAGKHAVAISMTDKVELAAVASRNLASAQGFTAKHGGEPVEGFEALCAREDVDAVYIAVPTAAKEEIAVEALMEGKHVLVEKPLPSARAAYRLERIARRRGLTLWDATHFTHNPRTPHLYDAIERGLIGQPLTLVTSFHADVGGSENIRYKTALEPQGVLGDLGWYCARLVSELVPSAFETSGGYGKGTWQRNALVGISSVTEFMSDGFRLVMDCSFEAGAFCQEMRLTGTEGSIQMDDFVHDWERARIGEEKPQFPAGYRLSRGRTDPGTVEFISTPAEKSHMILMLENFADEIGDGPSPDVLAGGLTMCKTQEFLDDIWRHLAFKPAGRAQG
jgi:predicted dehydrogenase